MSRNKRVSDHVMQRIRQALERMAEEPGLRRTKIEVERLSGLSHDAVARAFRQDANEPDNPWQITKFLQDLADPMHGRRSPHEVDLMEISLRLQEKQARIVELEEMVDRYAVALYAHHLLDRGTADGPRDDLVVPIGRNRARGKSR